MNGRVATVSKYFICVSFLVCYI